MATHDTRKDVTMADDGLKLDRWEEEQLAAIARDAVAVVRNKMLHQHAAEAERDKERARAEAAVKRAEGAELDAAQWREVAEGLQRGRDQVCEANARLVNRLHEIRQLVGGEEDLVEGVRALKKRCEGAEREAKLAKGALADGASEAAAARIRAGVAEAQVAERNAEVDRFKRDAASLLDRIQEYEVAFAAINRALDGCDTPLDADKVVAKIRALKDQRDDSEASCLTAQAEQERLEREVASLRAQVESLRGQNGSAWSGWVNEQRKRASRRSDAFMEILAKTGWLRCTSCGEETPEPKEIGDGIIQGGKWTWGPMFSCWYHWCSGKSAGYVADRIFVERVADPDDVPAPVVASPKTGMWKCSACGVEVYIGTGGVPTAKPRGGWFEWVDVNPGYWVHFCPDKVCGYPCDRLGDAPKVTP